VFGGAPREEHGTRWRERDARDRWHRCGIDLIQTAVLYECRVERIGEREEGVGGVEVERGEVDALVREVQPSHPDDGVQALCNVSAGHAIEGLQDKDGLEDHHGTGNHLLLAVLDA